jgi:cytoskeletal protein CcmA (bactofilin family)
VATVWIPVAGLWIRGCPIGVATQVRILSTGYAQSAGVAGVSADNSTSIEVILGAVTSSTSITATGPAIYSYSSQGFGGGGKLISIDGSSPAIMVKVGDLTCDGGAEGIANLVVEGGSLTVGSGCKINGNVWATGRVTVTGGPDISGNVVGNGVTINGGSDVGGSVWSTSDVLMDGGPLVVGNVTAASLTMQGEIKGNTWVYGATKLNWGSLIRGTVMTKTLDVPAYSNMINGAITQTNPGTPVASPYVTPTRPVVATWVDFGYNASQWSGFSEIVLTAAECNIAAFQVKATLLAGQPGLIDARVCSDFTLGSYQKLNLTGDLAIIANKFTFGGSAGFTSTGNRRLWLINPDTTADGLPTCAAGQSFTIDGGFTFATSLSVMMYSPCAVAIGSSTNFRGQVFSGKASINGGSTIAYVAVGLPGVDLDTGTSSVPSGTEANRTVVSSRNVQAGN